VEETTKKLGWLHLTDLQIGGQEAYEVFSELLEDVEQLRDEVKANLGFVVITGDLTASGAQEEFRVARRLLDQLLTTLRLPKENLYIVPGNHDVSKLTFPKIEPGEPYTRLEGQLDNYFEFIRTYLGKSAQETFIETIRWNGPRTAVIGLNTAELDESNRASLQPITQQAEKALDRVDRSGIKLLFMHNFLLLGRSSALNELTQACDFLLTGPIHNPDRPRVERLSNTTMAIRNVTTQHARRYPNAYNIVQLDFRTKEGTAYFRSYDEQTGWIEEEESPFSFPERLSSSEFSFPISFPVSFPDNREPVEPWSPPLAGYASDTVMGDDQLGIMPEVRAFSSVIASKNTVPPLCFGLFGDWGMGKTFFMQKLEEEISRLAVAAHKAESEEIETAYCSQVVQIRFNAWHYIDTNLWASLVQHIFEGMDDFIAEERKEEQRRHLLEEIKLARKFQEEAKSEEEAASQRVRDIESKLKDLREDRGDTEIKLRDLVLGLSLDNVLSEEDRKKIDDYATKLGIPEAYQNVADLEVALKEALTLGGRLQTAIRAPKNRDLLIIWSIAFLAGIPLLGIGVKWLLNNEVIDIVASIAIQLTAIAIGLATALRSLEDGIRPVIKKLEKAQRHAKARVQKQREEVAKNKAELEAQLIILKQREAVALNSLEEAQTRVSEAELALQKLQDPDPRKLSEFVQERIASCEYKQHLSVVSTVREDLEFLSRKLNSDEDLPRIDRIVLYIDDLDRCPERQVTAVLQAVHLLLAFRLFVVVVGVDSRWLLRSLEETYPTLQANTAKRAGWTEEEIWAWQSTPQNYLEKVFQIPYNLRPMTQSGFEQLVDSILPPVEVTESSDASDLDSTLSNSEESLSPEQPIPSSSEPIRQISEIDLTPETLSITLAERDFISELASLIPSPRTAKRFINIYRLIRAQLSPTGLDTFIGNSESPGEHRVVVLLLAILTGFPRQAPSIFRQILESHRELNWQALVEMMKPRQNVDDKLYANGFVPNMSVGEAAQWKQLYVKLRELEKAPGSISLYNKWVRQVARFSFQVGRITTQISLGAEIRIAHIENSSEGSDTSAEYVKIENVGEVTQNMRGWRLNDQANHTFEFPDFTLPPNRAANVWIGEGSDTVTDLYWGIKTAVLTDAGDKAELYDANGLLISSYTLPSK
jgi:hypothetical protein